MYGNHVGGSDDEIVPLFATVPDIGKTETLSKRDISMDTVNIGNVKAEQCTWDKFAKIPM